MAMFDQGCAERSHGRIFFQRIAVGDDDRGLEPRGSGGAHLRLAVIATGCGDDAGDMRVRTAEPVDLGDRPAHLERPGRRVIFMLYPEFASRARGQQRPGILRGWRHLGMDHRGSGTERSKGEICHDSRNKPGAGNRTEPLR